MGIVMGADTATNTQPAASPQRYLQGYWKPYTYNNKLYNLYIRQTNFDN